ncbi:acyltransferase family protein [Ureibacillus composti]|nr:acyltransferase family protein [Ureibacillus composti]
MGDLKVPIKKFRPEIEGVRTVAALLVAIYHIWLGSVSGGVDVFFIVSGFLITTSLLSRIEKFGKINLLEYYLGLAKRLFPLAFTVLLFTTIVSVLIMPKAQWRQIISEVFSSTFYFQNWRLSFNSVDYLAQNNEASPLQHFWALSIQGQFYLTWPFIILLSYYIARKVLKTPVRKTLLAVLIVIFTLSITYSVYITAVNQPWAYFDTFARAWEFSLGGILALLIPYLSFNKSMSMLIGWIGLAIICLTGILLPVSTVFPGFAALLPTSGVILILISAENSSRFGVNRLLGSKPFLLFGNISYGFYLWHFPLLIFYFAYTGNETVTLLGGIALLLMTFVLSLISTKVIEAPVRKINLKQSKIKAISIVIAFMLPVLIANSSWRVYVEQSNESLKGIQSLEDYPGARSIFENISPTPGLEPFPSTALIKEDLPAFYNQPGCVSWQGSQVTKCSFGVLENPDYTIGLVGGSHSGHWFPALEQLTNELNIKIDVYNQDGCRFTDDDFGGILTESCMEWNRLVIEELQVNPPDLVFTTANVNNGDTIPEGYLSQWEKLEGITEIFAIRDNPRMKQDIPLCIEREKDDNNCSISRDKALSEIPPWENTEVIPSNVTFGDLSDSFCDNQTCPPVIGNVIVYRDKHHISTAYSRTLAPALKEQLIVAFERIKK